MPAPSAGIARLHGRLAAFYFFYYATVGAFLPYWASYLQARGFTAVQMGLAFALMGVMRTLVPLAWGWWADHSGRRIGLIRWAAVAALLTFMAIPFVDGVLWIGALMIGYTLFWHALLPQFEVVALAHLQASGGDYSRVRLWGSVGFVVAVMGLGWALDWTGILWLPWLVGAFWLGMAIATWFVPESPRLHPLDAPRSAVQDVLRRPQVLALLVACLASQLSFAPYYNFFTLFLETHGYSRGAAGMLWSIGVLAEIALFVFIGRVLVHVGARALMLAALMATALRWCLTAAAVDAWPVLVAAQLSHAVTFGAYHVVAMHYVQRLFPADLQGRAQAIYNAVAYGIGGSIGSLAAGYVWEHIAPEAVFYAAGAVALGGWWVAWRWLPATRA
ncbi:MFS transporter, PPP family, 3-phenylpropionic acid transporter [Fontimonas thermophila]|uniref:MFS transporter, PPP family, 3-phenylpropionic acid transporter n=1 Tax=Fontimonas thermophila TaxID=1076937 RepID=A0A1I2HQZ4_9GAMM|nr:MFS transporter [Fontimonas thermophila]SFF31166.1 MFS transporter, PPP family, 3-phenylpropionic acid transporter [Fontimonas thermophila]